MKKNNVWSSVLQEQVLCEDILKFNVQTTNTTTQVQREVETYDLKPNSSSKNPRKSPKKSKNSKKTNCIKNPFNGKTVVIVNDLANSPSPQQPVGERVNFQITYDQTKSREHIQANEFDSDEIICKVIVQMLREQNTDLIGIFDIHGLDIGRNMHLKSKTTDCAFEFKARCVKTLGRKKCLELLYATEDIEENNGLPTDDGKRRRTPGGVFITLIKRDLTILSEQKKKIFELKPEEKKMKKKRKRLMQKARFDNKKNELREKVRKSVEKKFEALQEDDRVDLQFDLNERSSSESFLNESIDIQLE